MFAPRRTWIVVLALVALALLLRLRGIDHGLPMVYEEAYPFKKSWEMWGWGAKKQLDFNPHFFNYPTLFFYVQFLGQGLLYLILKARGVVETALDFRVLYELDKTPFYLLGRGISALCGVATVLATLACGRRIGGFAVGIPAAALVAVNHMHVVKSRVIEVDVPLTLCSTLCILYALRIVEQPSRRNYLLAGLWGGLATSTKYSGAMLALPIVLAHAIAWWRTRQGGSNVLIAGVVFAAALFLTSPYILLDRSAFWTGFNYERLHMRLGHFGLDQTPAIVYYARVLGGSLLGLPLALAALAGGLYAGILRRQAWAAVLVVFPLVYIAVISSWSMKAERYVLPLVPLAALYAAAWAAALAPKLARRHRAAPAAAMVAAWFVCAAPSLAALTREARSARADTRTLAYEWIVAHVPAGSMIVSEAYGPAIMGIIDLQNLQSDVFEVVNARPEIKVYALVALPMYQMLPENSSPFYDLPVYDERADYIITSSSIESRYRKEPQRYAAHNRFYDDLQRTWRLEREWGPADGSGPRLAVFRNPRFAEVPFAERPNPSGGRLPRITRDLMPGSAAGYYERLAFVYEAYGFERAAADIYRHGLLQRDQPFELRKNLLIGALRCLIRAGYGTEALAVLEDAERQPTSPAEASYATRLRQQLTTPAAPSDSVATGR